MCPDALHAHVSILSVDDHPLIREGLAALIATEPNMQVVGEAGNGEEAIEQYRTLRPDIVLMDLVMPVMDGLDAARAILDEFPDARIIMLTTYDGDEDIYRALDVGARGYLLKSMLRKDVLNVIRTVRAGGRGIPPDVAMKLAEFTPRAALTPRETEILKLIAKGCTNPEVARILGRTEGTIKVHVKNILQKLEASDRTEAVMLAVQRGFIRAG
ncbi:MAG: response regulator transcription factor [Gemmatimonadaceae bacterium]|nr:response regulator transcription factor [Gemmatimonadaceae bacterium]